MRLTTMSLRNKPIDEITYADVGAFCTTTPKPREVLQLDFKRAFPGDLSKIIAAFANTYGGLLVLGVETDASNEPKWPPLGLEASAQNSERIHHAAYDSIHPPVAIEVSAMLPLPDPPDRVLAVVRVPESPEAPHAMEGGRHIYIRTGDVSKRIDLADITRIERLLKRRGAAEQQRERMLNEMVARCRPQIAPDGPICWASAIVLYPAGALCDPIDCFRAMAGSDLGRADRIGGAPWGAYSSDAWRDPGGRNEISSAYIDCRGHVFEMKSCWDVGRSNSHRIMAERVQRVARETFQCASRFFELRARFTGYVQLSLGIEACRGACMYSGDTNLGSPFLDDSYRQSIVAPAPSLPADNAAEAMFARMRYDFNMSQDVKRTLLSATQPQVYRSH
jgi:hypothetical protein